MGAKTVVDLGCGEGKLLKALLHDKAFERLVGMDVSWRSLETAHRRLYMDQMPDAQRKRIELIHGSLMYRDKRLEGFDAATVIEVIEHLDPPRLAAFERVLFEMRPAAKRRSSRRRTRNTTSGSRRCQPASSGTRTTGSNGHAQEFAAWAHGIAERFGYAVAFLPIGPEDPVVGAPTQMGVFTR